ncbi:MAG TPA: serine hydrolase [Candidatus Lachnoclostridium pullistercoris]|uniref:Serine hydrolase n=1 Tax=Candidatus Lachnoclostridium pullistercoris TaxID=2838632 RepID=A0A9D2PBM0_9FIRM|nr:serine hydrolase [Candidatus Lachnoclostridium pullistercoris]
MERSVQVKRNRRAVSCLAAALLCAALLSGCGSEVKERPYSLAERSFSASGEEKAETFAADLCVPDGSGDYEDSEITAEAAALFSLEDGTVPYYKNMYEKMYPASITKVMTALVALRHGNLADEVTVTEDAVITESGASLCNIHPGDRLTLEQLLYGLMLPSGNDAGAAIAVHIAGSIPAFADMMNEEALALGATGTHFTNPHGLTDEDHYTTAYDLYLIFNEAMKEPKFRKIVGTSSYYAEYVNGAGETVSQTWKMGNQYMTGEQQAPEGVTVTGGKTGTTQAAGYCLIVSSEADDGGEYISVVMKADSRPALYGNMTNLMNKIVN